MQYESEPCVVVSAASQTTSQQVLTLPDKNGMPIQQKTRSFQAGYKAGNDIHQQVWQFVSSDMTGLFKIVSFATHNVLTVHSPVKEEGTVIVEAPDRGEPNQRWVLQVVDASANIGNLAFVIISAGSGRVLSVRDASTADHAVIEQDKWQYGPGKHQQWIILPADTSVGE